MLQFPSSFSMPRLLRRNWRSTLLGAIGLLIVLWSAVNIPGLAVSAKFTPEKPRLGETIVINIDTDPAQSTPANPTGKPITPTVKVGAKTYPTFVIGTNRFRSMIPTHH